MNYITYEILKQSFELQEHQRIKWQSNYDRSFSVGRLSAENGLPRKVPWSPPHLLYDPDGFYEGFDSVSNN